MPAQHSSIVGGSTASRIINCPASFASTLALPPGANIASEYAEEGTAMHAVMEHIMQRWKKQPAMTTPQLVTYAFTLIGTRFHDRTYTIDHHNTMVVPALNALHDLQMAYGGGFNVLAVERRVRFPRVAGAFGTIDLILASHRAVLHVDWKFGSGVPVLASYQDKPHDWRDFNAQLLFYMTGARSTLKATTTCYDGKHKLVAAIVQPRSDMPLTHALVPRQALDDFRDALVEAVDAALAPGARREKGEHCRWAPCKMTCPLWTGALLDISLLATIAPDSPAPAAQPSAYGRYLADAKALLDMAALLKREIDAQMHAYLEAGGSIPGWRLKAKATKRQWVGADTVTKKLRELGFKMDEIFTTELVTFKAADATAKRLGVEIPDELRVAPPTNETTIAADDDPAPVVDRGLAIEQFRASLAHLTGAA